MYWNLLSDFFKLPTLLIQTHFWQKFLVRWEGKRPPLALRFKFLRDTEIKFNKFSTFRMLDFDTLKYIQMRTSYFHHQIIKENKEDDLKLIEQSWINFYPHEVTQIKIKNSQKERMESKLHHGGPYQGASMKELRTEINRLCFSARKKGLIIEEVQIVHTHPSLEVMFCNDQDPSSSDGSSFIFNGLSKSDIKLGETLAPFIPYPLRIKAITTAANYSMLF